MSSQPKGYVIGSNPFFLLAYILLYPAANGPGLPIAVIAIKSSIQVGLISLHIPLNKLLSNWKTPSVFPSDNISYIFSSVLISLLLYNSSNVILIP